MFHHILTHNNALLDIYRRNSDFYNQFLDANPQPAKRTLVASREYSNKLGSVYSHSLHRYVAPMDGEAFREPDEIIKKLEFNVYYDWHSYIDTRARLNVAMHNAHFLKSGEDPIPGALDFTPASYTEFVKQRAANESFNQIRMITCHSANGGDRSIAATVAEHSGIPTTGFRGEVMTVASEYIHHKHQANQPMHQSVVGTRSYLQKNVKDGSWRPTALEREFHPSFGSPGFDDMSTFFEGIFVI